MIKKILLFSLIFYFFIPSYGQDLNIHVQVLSPQVQQTNKRTLEVLQSAIRDFMNNRKWTDYAVQPQERIDCFLVLTLSEWDGSSNFKGDAQIRSTRPIFNSTYNSPVLALSDAFFNFSYTEGEPLDYTDQQYSSNLSSLLAFYAYLIIGADADTFLPLGGTLAFQKANQVVINAQNSNFQGWGSNESTENRYWLNSNFLDRNYQGLREFSFAYHALVLDKMVEHKTVVNEVSGLFSDLSSVDRFGLGAVYPQVFFTAKTDEFASMVALMNMSDRLKSITVLKEIDPANGDKYEQLRNLN